MKIHVIKNPKLRVSEGTQFFGDVLTVCEKNKPSELNIKKQWDALGASYKLLTNSFKKDQSSQLTEDLVQLDDRRDQAIICLRKLADGYTDHHVEAMNNAGKVVLAAIDKYGSRISKMNYQAETSVIDNLVADLTQEEHNASAVKLLKINDVVKELGTANEEFNAVYLERVEEAASKDLSAASELLYECREKYNDLVKHIEANAIVNPSEAYDNLIKQLNSLIDKFNLMVALRAGRIESQKEDVSI